MYTVIHLVFLLLIWSASTPATTVKTFAFDGLCETAPTIVYVRCLEAKALIPEGRDGIFTRYRFAVINAIKGQPRSELAILLPGGTVGQSHTDVPGMPRFVVGQETVLFLSEMDDFGSPWPVGLGQGCYDVVVDPDGSRHVAQRQQNPADPALRAKPGQQASVALDTFLDAIREAVQSEKPGLDVKR
ncbi:MAG: hypothetical protein O3B73_14465 [bacterium]|jgi:hypothetical protein|nr:hypothetical protein [bacterium]